MQSLKALKAARTLIILTFLHDGGVAASEATLQREGDRYVVANPDQLGMAGTLLQGIRPDPSASLRVLLDRNLREPTVAANRANANLQRSNIDGSGHAYWVDSEAGFTRQQQDDLIQFLLSLDDDPEVLPLASGELANDAPELLVAGN